MYSWSPTYIPPGGSSTEVGDMLALLGDRVESWTSLTGPDVASLLLNECFSFGSGVQVSVSLGTST